MIYQLGKKDLLIKWIEQKFGPVTVSDYWGSRRIHINRFSDTSMTIDIDDVSGVNYYNKIKSSISSPHTTYVEEGNKKIKEINKRINLTKLEEHINDVVKLCRKRVEQKLIAEKTEEMKTMKIKGFLLRNSGLSIVKDESYNRFKITNHIPKSYNISVHVPVKVIDTISEESEIELKLDDPDQYDYICIPVKVKNIKKAYEHLVEVLKL